MKPPSFRYHAPTTVAEALGALAAAGLDGKVLAGGQSLVPLLNMRLASPRELVDVTGVAELATLRAGPDGVRVGAAVTQAAVERHPGAARACPPLAQALALVAHPVIRNRGTVCGSVAHADPAAEVPAVLALLGGTVHVAAAGAPGGPRRRDVPAGQFFLAPLTSALEPGELVEAVTFPALPPGAGSDFVEVARRHGDYALCGVAAVVALEPSGRVAQARVALVGVGPVPPVVDLGDIVAGADPQAPAWQAAAAAVGRAIDPETDIHATADYRRHLAGVLTRRALAGAAAQARERAAGGDGAPAAAVEPAAPAAAPRTRLTASPPPVSPPPDPGEPAEVVLDVNGVPRSATAPPRRLLSDFLRHDLGLTGTHVGCEHGVCGCCTVLLDGHPVRSCLVFAVSVRGRAVRTVEGLAPDPGELDAVQQAFQDCHGLQCGFCTPGFLMSVTGLLDEHPDPSDEEILEGISGNLCRCTGYQNIRAAVHRAAELRAAASGGNR